MDEIYLEEDFFADDNPLRTSREESSRLDFSGDLGNQIKISHSSMALEDETKESNPTISQSKWKVQKQNNGDEESTESDIEIRIKLQQTQETLNLLQLKIAALEAEQLKEKSRKEHNIEEEAKEADLEMQTKLLQTQETLNLFQLKVAALEAEKFQGKIMKVYDVGGEAKETDLDIRTKLLQTQDALNLFQDAEKHSSPSRHYLPEIESPKKIDSISSYVFQDTYNEGRLTIHDAVNSGDIESLEDIILNMPKAVYVLNQEGRTALHLACMNNSLGIAKLLILNGSIVNEKDAAGQTPLHLCSDTNIINLLCANEGSTLVRDNQGFTALYLHTLYNRAKIVQSLLAHSADPALEEPERHRNVLHCAANIENFDIISILLLESSISLDVQDTLGDTAMHILVANRSKEEAHLQAMPQGFLLQKCMMLLLDRGAKVNIQNKRGESILGLVCANRNLRATMATAPLVEMLLDMRANPNTQDSDGCTALMISALYGDWEVCRLLVEAGGDLNVPCTVTSHYLLNNRGDLRIQEECEDLKLSKNAVHATCIASDIVPKEMQSLLFSVICSPQTMVAKNDRLKCGECKKNFETVNQVAYPKTLSTFFSSFASSSGSDKGSKGRDTHSCTICNCLHCGRLLCNECLPHRLLQALMPLFLQDTVKEVSSLSGSRRRKSEPDIGSVKLCHLCFNILVN
jgi:ankyrin repeat protein